MFRRYSDMPRACHTVPRGAMTLLELLIAISILVMIGGTLGALTKGVQSSYQYTEATGRATQHARVVLERFTRAVSEARASEKFPGFKVIAEQIDGKRFPDTLVVWYPGPARSAADPEGLPRFDELAIYCPDPSEPSRLLEITIPGNNSQTPVWDDEAAWATEIDAIKQSGSVKKVQLTDLLRTGVVRVGTSGVRRGAVRFEPMFRPTDGDFSNYREAAKTGEAAGQSAWDGLPWVQGISNRQMGLRQAWLRVEIQLVPGSQSVSNGSAEQPLTFFGSAALVYTCTPQGVQTP